jgi:hypothetical protein
MFGYGLGWCRMIEMGIGGTEVLVKWYEVSQGRRILRICQSCTVYKHSLDTVMSTC